MTYLSIMFSQSSSSPLSPNTVAIVVVGTVHVRRWLCTKAACRHPVSPSQSLSGLQCLFVWLTLGRPRGSQSGHSWSNSCHYGFAGLNVYKLCWVGQCVWNRCKNYHEGWRRCAANIHRLHCLKCEYLLLFLVYVSVSWISLVFGLLLCLRNAVWELHLELWEYARDFIHCFY